MLTHFTDLTAPSYRGSLPRPRGLLPVPSEIRERVARDQARLQPHYTDQYAKRILDDWTLRYYYDGIHVAYRSVPVGVEVLAVGLEEIEKLVKEVPSAERADVIIKQP